MGILPDKVLFIEDAPSFHDVVKTFFESTGQSVEVRCCEGVDQALETLETFTPSLILLDLLMPEKDGVDFLAVMQTHAIGRTIPVILATAVDKVQMIPHWERLNILGVIHKPYEKETFITQVEDLWSRQLPE